MFNWFRNRRRRRALREPMPDLWWEWVDRHVWQHAHMNAIQRERVADIVRVLLVDKHWTGCGGLELIDEMRVAIAARAALLVLGPEEPYYFDRLRSILVYPQAYRAEVADTSSLFLSDRLNPGWGGPPRDTRLGESWQGGPVILSWQAIERESANPTDGANLVLHELAHHLDSLDGDMDGAPPMFRSQERKRWKLVVDEEYQRLVRSTRRREPTLLDKYGATDRAEFFSVTTECFFEQPHAMRTQHADLYDVLAGFYQQSPAEWITLPTA